MPVSKNKRKSKRGQRRKMSLTKAEGAFGGGGTPEDFDRSPQLAPTVAPPDVTSQGEASTENPGTE